MTKLVKNSVIQDLNSSLKNKIINPGAFGDEYIERLTKSPGETKLIRVWARVTLDSTIKFENARYENSNVEAIKDIETGELIAMRFL